MTTSTPASALGEAPDLGQHLPELLDGLAALAPPDEAALRSATWVIRRGDA